MDTRQCLELLELECVSSPRELKDAYRKMVKRWHPDRYHGDPRLMQQAELKLTEINLAYKHLLAYFDPNLRKSIKVACPQPDQKASFHESVNPSANSHKEPAGGFAGEKNADPKSSAQFDNIKIQSASKKQGRRNRCEKLTEQSINLLGNSLSFLRRQETGEFVCGRTVLCI